MSISPQQYAIDNGISVQQAKRDLGRRTSKNAFKAKGSGAPARTTPTLVSDNPAPVAAVDPAAAPATKAA